MQRKTIANMQNGARNESEHANGARASEKESEHAKRCENEGKQAMQVRKQNIVKAMQCRCENMQRGEIKQVKRGKRCKCENKHQLRTVRCRSEDLQRRKKASRGITTIPRLFPTKLSHDVSCTLPKARGAIGSWKRGKKAAVSSESKENSTQRH